MENSVCLVPPDRVHVDLLASAHLGKDGESIFEVEAPTGQILFPQW